MKLEKTFLKPSMLLLLIAAFIGIAGVSTSNAQVMVKTILDRMEGNYQTLDSFQSDVVIVDYNDQLGTKDKTEATVSYLPKKKGKPMYVRMDWTKPLVQKMIVIGDKFLLYREHLRVAYTGTTDSASKNKSAGGALKFLTMSRDQLKANYEVSYVGPEGLSGGIQTWHILLKPKGTVSYKFADLWIDKDGMPRQATITEKNDDTSTILLTNIKKNVTIDASIFKWKPPQGTTFQAT